MVTNSGGDEIAVAASEANDVAIKCQILSMLVMTAIAYGVANIVKERGGFQKDARFSGEMMHGLKLIEKLETYFANVLGVATVAIEAPREYARADEKLACVGVVAVRLLARKGFSCNFAEQAFANADAGNRKRAQIQVPTERDEN